MFCTKCGNQIPEGAKFCSRCGAQIAAAPVVEQPVTEPVVEQPVVEQPVEVVEPVVEQLVTEPVVAPVVEQPVEVVEPIVEQPVEAVVSIVEQPVVQQQEYQQFNQQVQQPEQQQFNQQVQQPEQQQFNQQVQQPEQQQLNQQPKKSKKKIIIIAACVVAALLIGGCLGFYFYASGVQKDFKQARTEYAKLLADSKLESNTELNSLLVRCNEVESIFAISDMKELNSELETATVKCEKISKEVVERRKLWEEYNKNIAECRMSSELESKKNSIDADIEKYLRNGDLSKADEAISELSVCTNEAITYTVGLINDIVKAYEELELSALTLDELNALSAAWNDVYDVYNEGRYADACTIAEDNYQKAKNAVESILDAAEAERLEQERRLEEERLAEEKRKEEEYQAKVADGLPTDTVRIVTVDYAIDIPTLGPDVEKLFEATGVKVEIENYPAWEFVDRVNSDIASGNVADVYLVPATDFEELASTVTNFGDITDVWNEVKYELDNYYFVNAQDYMCMADGRLYGLTVTLPLSQVVYIRESWLNKYGLDVPTTYKEFENMLKVFTEGDSDDSGDPSNTYGIMIPYGGVATEYEKQALGVFLQDAIPEFYLRDDGAFVDGFAEQEMIDALARISKLYKAGAIKGLNNDIMGYEDFTSGKCGAIITYADAYTKSGLEQEMLDYGAYDNLIVMPPLAEMRGYSGEYNEIFMINPDSNAKGIIKYVIAEMLDGGEAQFIWTYGDADATDENKTEVSNAFSSAMAITGIDPMYSYEESYLDEEEMRDIINSYVVPRGYEYFDFESTFEYDLLEYRREAFYNIINGMKPKKAIEQYVKDTKSIIDNAGVG